MNHCVVLCCSEQSPAREDFGGNLQDGRWSAPVSREGEASWMFRMQMLIGLYLLLLASLLLVVRPGAPSSVLAPRIVFTHPPIYLFFYKLSSCGLGKVQSFLPRVSHVVS